MRKFIVVLFCLMVFLSAQRGVCADASYKQVIISTNAEAIRVRLPLTDVTGKVRVKEQSADGFGLSIAPSKTVLGKKHYLE